MNSRPVSFLGQDGGDLVNPPAIKANLEKLRQGQDIN